MADGFVEEHAAHPGSQDHGHLTGRGGDRIEHRYGSLGRLLPDRRGAEATEELEPSAGGRPEEPRLDRAVAGGDDLRDEPDPRALLLDPATVRGGDQPPLEGIAVHPDHLHDLGAQAPGGVVELPEPGDLVGGRERSSRAIRPIHAGAHPGGQVDDRSRLAFPERGARSVRRLQEGVAIETVRVRVAVGRAEDDTDAGSAIEAARQLLHLAVVQADRRGRPLLDEELGERAAASTRSTQHFLDELAGQHARDANSGAVNDFPNSQHDHKQEERERGDRTPDPSEELIAG